MKDREFILAEFAFEDLDSWSNGINLLEKFEKEGKLEILSSVSGIFADRPGIISVKIDPLFATVLKLQSAFLAERMRISYISDELKDKYRK